jgi:hypothetical protein
MCIKIKNKIFLSSQINVHGYGVQRHFQQYFSYIVAVSFISGVPGEKHRPTTSHWQTWSHYVVSSIPRHKQDSNSQL